MVRHYFNDLIQFISTHRDNWAQILPTEPYFVNVKQCPFQDEKGRLLYPHAYMLSYRQFDSDFTNPIVRACRGSIVDVSDIEHPKMICAPFYKFVNYGQEGQDDIDWSSVKVLDKIDGMLIKLWYSETLKRWVWVTNNGWNITCTLPETLASKYKEKATENATCFYDLVKVAITNAGFENEKELFDGLSKDYTYMFELTSPKARIICDYKITVMWYLGCRNNQTFQEESPDVLPLSHVLNHFLQPSVFEDKSLEDVLKRCDSYSDIEHEGVVVCDKYFRRFKIKCNEYLKVKFQKSDNGFTEKFLLETIRTGQEDDLLSLFPECLDKINKVKEKISRFATILKQKIAFGREVYAQIEPDYPDNIAAKKAYAAIVEEKYKKDEVTMYMALKSDEYIDDFIKSDRVTIYYINNFLTKEGEPI